MTKIKICGITREAEVEVLNECRVDYAGFVIFPDSKRYVTVERAKKLKYHLDIGIQSVAVTVNPDLNLIREIESAGFDVLQIHRDLDMEKLDYVSIPVWLALQVKKENFSLPAFCDKIEKILLDAPQYGSGKTFDWEQFPFSRQELWQGRELILAGGLTAENVTRGMDLFHPYAVDVSSSVEGENGKDPDKIKAFVRKVREHE